MDFVHYQSDLYQDNSAAVFLGKVEVQHQTSSMRLDVGQVSEEGHPIVPTEETEESEISTRPRLTREQVWLLEKQFQTHHKPNSNTKRQLADQTGLSLQRVANWFQNRRAKAKQQKKQEEYEVMQTIESAGRFNYTEPSTPSLFYPADYYSSDMDRTRQRSMIEDMSAPTNYAGSIEGLPRHTQYESPSEASYASLARSLAAAEAAVAQGSFDNHMLEGSQGLPRCDYPVDTHAVSTSYQIDNNLSKNSFSNNVTPFTVSAFSDYGSSRTSSVTWTPAMQLEDPFETIDNDMRFGQLPVQSSDLSNVFVDCAGTIDCNQSQSSFLLPPFLSQIPPEQQPQQQYELHTIPPSAHLSDDLHFTRSSCFSDVSENFHSVDGRPQSNLNSEFKQPEAPMNIAARRKRPRPAAIGNAALQNQTPVCSVPVSPCSNAGFTNSSSPMRRIKSTGNNHNLSRGRIQKVTPSSAQRSPLNLATFADAGAFREANIVNKLPTPSTNSLSVRGSFAPPTPVSPLDMERLQIENASNNDKIEPAFVYSPNYSNIFAPTMIEMHSNLASPPTTPQDADLHARVHYDTFNSNSPPHSTGYPYPTHYLSDAPLVSPELTSFPSMIHMPQPMYVSPLSCGESDMVDLSQCSKPSPQMSSNGNRSASRSKVVPEFFFHEFPQQPQASVKTPSRASQHKPKNYIFANQTPEDF
ncbi:MAG: hypothetical protein M1827_006446 [Pycnora praestabilis]|nr:MAG: hypothetical protein M1827_006446 [Pycnora praestabilis]